MREQAGIPCGGENKHWAGRDESTRENADIVQSDELKVGFGEARLYQPICVRYSFGFLGGPGGYRRTDDPDCGWQIGTNYTEVNHE